MTTKRGPSPRLTPDQLTELARRYPHEGNHALAEAFGLTWVFVRNLAAKMGLKKTAERIVERRKTDAHARHAAGNSSWLLPDARLPEFIARYPHVSNAELAVEFGVSPRFCKNKGYDLGLKKTAARISMARGDRLGKHPRVTPLRDTIHAHVEAQRSRGATAATITSALCESSGQVATAIRHMTDGGRLIRIAGRPNVYFTNPVWAREHLETKNREQIAAAQATQARKRAAEASERAKVHAKAAAASWPAFEVKQSTTPAGVKVTRVVMPPVDGRYLCAPGADVPRVFSMVPPGRDPMTGREWGQGL